MKRSIGKLLSAVVVIGCLTLAPPSKDAGSAQAAPGAPRSAAKGGGQPPKPPKKHGPRQTRSKDGEYTTVASGFWHGTGGADVKNDKVSIKIDLVSDDGRSAKLVANNLSIDGPYFTGVGNMKGQDVYISGRLDAAKASRLTATFEVEDGKTGRMIGRLPASVDAGDEQWEMTGKG